MIIEVVAAYVRSVLLASGLDARDLPYRRPYDSSWAFMSFHVDKEIYDLENLWVGGGLLYFVDGMVGNTYFSVPISDPNFAVNFIRIVKSSRIYEKQVEEMAIQRRMCES